MSLASIRDIIHNRYLRARALDRIVSGQRFAAALKIDDNPPLDSPEALEAWINTKLSSELEDMSMRLLRQRASALGIPFYTCYAKSALILKIIEVQDNARKAQQAPVDVSAAETESHSNCSFDSNGKVPHPASA